jgi:hypothetical protein
MPPASPAWSQGDCCLREMPPIAVGCFDKWFLLRKERPPLCHSQRSEESRSNADVHEILRCAQNDEKGFPQQKPSSKRFSEVTRERTRNQKRLRVATPRASTPSKRGGSIISRDRILFDIQSVRNHDKSNGMRSLRKMGWLYKTSDLNCAKILDSFANIGLDGGYCAGCVRWPGKVASSA